MNIKNGSNFRNSYLNAHKQFCINNSQSPFLASTISGIHSNKLYTSTTFKSTNIQSTIPITLFSYNDEQSELNTNDSLASANNIEQNNKTINKNIRKNGVFVPLSKLSTASIENLSKIIEPFAIRTSHLEGDDLKKSHKGHTLSMELSLKRDMLNQLMKNQLKNNNDNNYDYNTRTHKPMQIKSNEDYINFNNNDNNNCFTSSPSNIQPLQYNPYYTLTDSCIKNHQFQEQQKRINHRKTNSIQLKSTIKEDQVKRKDISDDEINIENDINTTVSFILPQENDTIDNDISLISYEDLLLIEDKLHDILSLITLNSPPENECFEWWNHYFNSTLPGKFDKYFLFKSNTKKIISYINIELLCVMLCYAICSYTNQSKFTSYLKSFKSIFSSLHFNLLLMIKFIITKQQGNDLSFMKLNQMLKQSLTTINEKDIDENLITNMIAYNMAEITILYLGIVEKEYQNTMGNSLKYFFHYAYDNRERIPVEEYNEFFRLNVIKVKNVNGNILASSLVTNDNENWKDIGYSDGNSNRNGNNYSNGKGSNIKKDLWKVLKPKVPYLPIIIYPKYINTKNNIKYTLVLDLDETLIHLKENSNNNSIINGFKSNRNSNNNENDNQNLQTLLFRPGMFSFLKKMKTQFEIIVFTAGTQEYAKPIIEAIEVNEKYFDHCLYREHVLVVGNDFVKDITKLGRDISKIIIVDNKPQNFKLQKNNGIFIKPYYGDNLNDNVLIYLGIILNKIANDKGDIRNGIAKYKNEILIKVTLNK